MELTRRAFLELSVPAAAGALVAACNRLKKIPPTSEADPETEEKHPPLLKEPAREITSAPEVLKKDAPPPPEDPPEPTCTLPQVEKEPKRITAFGYIETDPADPSLETARFVFPPGVVDGDSPLVPKRELVSVFFRLESGTSIEEYAVEMNEILGTETEKVIVSGDASKFTSIETIADHLASLEALAVNQGNPLTFDDEARKVIGKIEIGHAHSQTGDPGINIRLLLPNEDLVFTDKRGSHLVNPAQSFFAGKVGLGIRRRGEVKPGTVLGPIPLVAKDGIISFSESQERVEVEDIDFNAKPLEIKIESREQGDRSEGGSRVATKSEEGSQEEKDSEDTPAVVAGPTPIVVRTERKKPGSDSGEESKWAKREYKPNETVSLKEWWDDMVANGHIRVDSVAQRYAGQQINDFLNQANLVPNPDAYYEKHLSFYGNCKTILSDLVTSGQGHITITSEAYNQVPGSEDCQVYSKSE